MNNKGLDAETIMNETPNNINDADKPLKREKNLTQKEVWKKKYATNHASLNKFCIR